MKMGTWLFLFAGVPVTSYWRRWSLVVVGYCWLLLLYFGYWPFMVSIGHWLDKYYCYLRFTVFVNVGLSNP